VNLFGAKIANSTDSMTAHLAKGGCVLKTTRQGTEMTSAQEEKGKTMLTSDGYCLTYNKPQNRIVICLPQTYETATNTYEQVADRRTDVMEIDLTVLLEITKLIFHKGVRIDDEAD
jgi:hypothetical protein